MTVEKAGILARPDRKESFPTVTSIHIIRENMMSGISMLDGKHPVWNICRLFVVFVGFTVFSYLNADKFDESEIRTILEVGALISGFELAKKKFTTPKE